MKKNKLVLFIVMIFPTMLLAQKKAALEIIPLKGNLYVYTTYMDYGGTPFPSNSMYLVTGKGVILFDTPWDTTQFQPLLDSIEKRHEQKVVLCIATHFHEDRTAGLDFLRSKGVKTYTSAFTKELCRQTNKPQAEFVFTKDTIFNVGEQRFEVFYPGEGHSKDNIVIWVVKERVMYGGCFVKSTESKDLGNLSDANVVAWPESVRKVMKKYPSPSFIIPGHFGWESNQSLEHTLKLLEKHKQQ